MTSPTNPRRPANRPAAIAAAILLAALLAACNIPTLSPTIPVPQPAATQLPPPPTPHPNNSPWAKQRTDAVTALYQPTPAGAALLRSLDLRQMTGEPGFFGSYGFDLWAGVGEAKPIGVMHELMHSYWGGFPVIGRPELHWQKQDGQEIAPALAAYHQDILTFMSQPPDDYEILRQRLRNLPQLSAENPGPLFHSLEADLPYTTGGDLALVPPILRKYWGLFLANGPFQTWQQAAGWFQNLSPQERATANKYLGFEHLDLRQYPNLPPYSPPNAPLSAAAQTLAQEERQRLTDLAEQFDLLIGDPQLDENFQFWRGYLQDKLSLYRWRPNHLETLPLPRARDLSDALKFLAALQGSPSEKARQLAAQIPVQPFLVNFLPALDNPTLLTLFADNPTLPQGATLQATASFVQRLQRFSTIVDRVLTEGQKSPAQGATALKNFLTDTGLDQEQDLKLFFDLFHDANPNSARQIMTATNKTTIQALMPPVPTQLRNILPPQTLLDKLNITPTAPEPDLQRGITLLINEPSGNYRIDRPFLERLYSIMAQRAQTSPAQAAQTIAATPFPLEAMILQQPAAASAALSANPNLAATLIETSDPTIAPPPRLIYRLIIADPTLAANLLITLDQQGKTRLATESLAYLAYDKTRSAQFPNLPISLTQDGKFLNSLLEQQGPKWLTTRLTNAVTLYRQRTNAAEAPPNFLPNYRQTLQAAANTQPPQAATRLHQIIQAAFT